MAQQEPRCPGPAAAELGAARAPEVRSRVNAAPLCKQDLVDYLASGCRPKEAWKIGTEQEKFGFNTSTLEPITYEEIASLLKGIADRFGWEPIMEGSKIVGLKGNGQSVTLEPAGQLELSGAPVGTVHQTSEEILSHLKQVKCVADELQLGFLGMGFDPKNALDQIPIMPKERYAVIASQHRRGDAWSETAYRTCSVQVNLDFSSEQDMVDKFRIGLALQPIATALFASSPFTEGKPNGFLSYRSQVWEESDARRAGDLPIVFDNDFGFEKYVDFALDVPMFTVERDNRYINAEGLSFRDFLAGRLPVLPGEYATMKDWEDHVGCIYKGVRLKRYLEFRGADVTPLDRLCGLPAFWVGLLYDETSLHGARDIISDWTNEERKTLMRMVPKQGLKTPFRGRHLCHVAQQVLELAKAGLERRGHGEEVYLVELQRSVATGVTLADELLQLFDTKWKGDIRPVYQYLKY